MSKADDLLNLCLEHIGEWTCATCGSNSAQPAAIFREVKNRGYHFEEISPNRWGQTMYCSRCRLDRTHYKLLSSEPDLRSRNGSAYLLKKEKESLQFWVGVMLLQVQALHLHQKLIIKFLGQGLMATLKQQLLIKIYWSKLVIVNLLL